MSDLMVEVRTLARGQGAHLVGVASIDRFDGAPKGHHPTDLLPGARSVVVIAHRFFQSVHQCKRRNRNGTLPHIRYCWGVCPVGKRVDKKEVSR